jgi:predicted DNA-binding transcriptional regulator AlpA
MQFHTKVDVPESAVSPQLAVPSTKQALMREHEAAQLLGHSVAALRKWRVKGGGPRYVKISRRSVRYRHLDLLDWIERHLVRNTSEVLR